MEFFCAVFEWCEIAGEIRFIFSPWYCLCVQSGWGKKNVSRPVKVHRKCIYREKNSSRKKSNFDIGLL